MDRLESKNMTVGEATLEVYKVIDSIGYEFNSDDFNKLKKEVLGCIESHDNHERVKEIFEFVFDNYNELKGLIN